MAVVFIARKPVRPPIWRSEAKVGKRAVAVK
jgi:hypothetical protein